MSMSHTGFLFFFHIYIYEQGEHLKLIHELANGRERKSIDSGRRSGHLLRVDGTV